MPLPTARNVLYTPYAIGNGIICVLYTVIRCTRLNNWLFTPEAGRTGGTLSIRESEIQMFLMCIVLFKARRAENMEGFLSSAFNFAKVANAYMFWQADALYGVLYGIVCLLAMAFLPVPIYKGPDKTMPLTSDKLFSMLEVDKEAGTDTAPKFLLVNFFCTWSPPCMYMKRDFAAVSLRYSAAFLRFARIDVGRYAAIATKYGIDTHVRSAQVPTVILFRNCVEVDRRPKVGTANQVIKCKFSQEMIEAEFALEKRLAEGANGVDGAATKAGKAAKKNA